MRKVNYTFTKPQNYYNHLLTFFMVISLLLTLSLVSFDISNYLDFLFKFIVILFLLLVIAAMIEFFSAGDYMTPHEIYNILNFCEGFLKELHSNRSLNKFHHKYNSKLKISLCELRSEMYFVSSVKRLNNIYEVVIINEIKMFQFFILRFLIKKAIKKLHFIRNGDSFKLIHIE